MSAGRDLLTLRPDNAADRFIASIVADDPKLRAALTIVRAMSPPEVDAWLEVGRRMVEVPKG